MSTFETARTGLLWDATSVPNAFFCEFMPAAPEGHVKVYLYGLMWARSGVADDGDLLDEMARALQMDRTEIERAMRYWERCRLVERIQDLPPRYRFASVTLTRLEREQLPRDEAYESFAQAVYAAFGDRRKLHGGETVLAYEWVEQYKLRPEVVLMLIQHMITTRGVNFSFKEAQKAAMELCEQHVDTLEQAEAVFSRSEAAMRGARKVLNHLGLRRNPSMDEMDLYLKWTHEWGFAPKAVIEACKETTKGSPTFAYLDKVLEGLHARSEGAKLTEKHVQKVLTDEKAELSAVREFLQALGISMAVVDDGLKLEYRSLAQYGGHELCMLAAHEVVTHSKVHTIDNVRQLLDSWTKKGLTTIESVSEYLSEVEVLNARIRELMEIAKATGGCTLDNRSRLKQWQTEWHMPQALIELAAEFARGTAKPMQYMHKLLSAWHDESIANVEEARLSHERHLAELTKKPAAASAASTGKRVIEQQYGQRTYDPAELDGITPEQLEEMNKL